MILMEGTQNVAPGELIKDQFEWKMRKRSIVEAIQVQIQVRLCQFDIPNSCGGVT